MGSCIVASETVLLPAAQGLSPQPALIFIEGGRVERVERFASVREWDEALTKLKSAHIEGTIDALPVVDARAHVVSPAFVNAHTHLCMNFFRAFQTRASASGNMVEDLFFRLESHLEEQDVLAFSRIGALECLLSGTGLVWDHYYHAAAVAQALEETGLCGVVAPTLQDLSGPGRQGTEEALDLTLRLHQDERRATQGIHAALGPHATDTVSSGLWERILETSRAKGLPIHSHVAQSPEEYERLMEREGTSPVGFLARKGAFDTGSTFLAVHSIYVTRTDLASMAKGADAALVFCPYSQLVFHFPADVRAWDAKGLRWCVATDCAASNDSMAVQKELRYVAGLEAAAWSFGSEYQSFNHARSREAALGWAKEIRKARARRGQSGSFSDQALFARATSIPGSLHPRFRAGEISPGALANLCLWRKDSPSLWPTTDPVRSLVWSDSADSLEGVMCNGRWIIPPGTSALEKLRNDKDYLEIEKEARDRLGALVKRAGLGDLHLSKSHDK